MIHPDDLTHTPRQTACDIAYAAFAVWATFGVHQFVMANGESATSWLQVLPQALYVTLGIASMMLYFVLLMCLPMFWAILWPRRFMPSSAAIFGAFLIFNGYMVFSAGR
ncbi:hypothetical protein [uncultured Halomonas sp.]|uniref:hypothetical protein n=1 Tax=uncultured Halomonas sp. TaxID=173971 RepID=UPI00262F2011|nr:hypothetical protein [uncultured Halomonas sp.]